eukprot:3821185-Rhodomonas_salina.5
MGRLGVLASMRVWDVDFACQRYGPATSTGVQGITDVLGAGWVEGYRGRARDTDYTDSTAAFRVVRGGGPCVVHVLSLRLRLDAGPAPSSARCPP